MGQMRNISKIILRESVIELTSATPISLSFLTPCLGLCCWLGVLIVSIQSVTTTPTTEKDELRSLNFVSALKSTKECLNLRRVCFFISLYSQQFHPSFLRFLRKNLLARVPLAVSGLNVITSPQDRSSANVIGMEIIHSVQRR